MSQCTHISVQYFCLRLSLPLDSRSVMFSHSIVNNLRVVFNTSRYFYLFLVINLLRAEFLDETENHIHLSYYFSITICNRRLKPFLVEGKDLFILLINAMAVDDLAMQGISNHGCQSSFLQYSRLIIRWFKMKFI